MPSAIVILEMYHTIPDKYGRYPDTLDGEWLLEKGFRAAKDEMAFYKESRFTFIEVRVKHGRRR